MALRKLQVDIRDSYDVAHLFGLTDGNTVSALPPGYQIGADGEIHEYINTAQRNAAYGERLQSRQERNQSNIGERNYIDAESFNAMTTAGRKAEDARIAGEADYWASVESQGFPWWALSGGVAAPVISKPVAGSDYAVSGFNNTRVPGTGPFGIY